MSVAGSIRKFTVEGQVFDVAFDANSSGLLNKFENSRVRHSGGSMSKKVLRVPTVENIVLITDWAAKEDLKAFANQIEDVKMLIEYAGGDKIKAEGSFNIESDESEENRTTISLHPRDEWTVETA